ncbi:hypothetical protein [Flavilitoribacter nigricans]|uniref:Uncharacterized protein n=1 Tax=Flavilitoribacter nigricans (strain ATCC 23147 / DSM 23189 / NBRC 102662 / NCIMB 1420 / SS-2) TaxID=1122177 RepID=A0A2D0N846_FLAN2|nr:hypothetical protein [Flavilitoribacter nigricans]PHN04682.1 hypothetical protein CRP01_19385 [Flavilitoribacter nigricans DSM 23189 = NBRC 102662]
MKKELQNIQVGAGLGSILFGMSRAEISAIIGEPNEKITESYTDDGENLTEIWHYDELELSLGFDEEDDWQLVSIAVTSPFYLLESVSLIGKEVEAVQTELQNIGVSDLELEDWSSAENPDHKLLTSDDESMNFWFDQDILTEIQWSPLFADEETILFTQINGQ